MITLTHPILVSNSIGGTTTTSYDTLRLSNMLLDPVTQLVTAQVQIRASLNALAPLIQGTLTLTTQGSPLGMLSVPNLGIFIPISMANGVAATVQGWITSMQNTIEQGLVGVAAVTGTQSTGV